MAELHIWVANFESEEAFEKYFDQVSYLKAWSIYDNEPPTGKEEDDQEPDPEIRCQFCKEIGIDTYDEDFIVLKYYHKRQQINDVLNDVPGNTSAFLKLYEENSIDSINVLIAYENHDLNQESASKTEKLIYLGAIPGLSDNDDKANLNTHYLWLGKDETSSSILESLNDDKQLSKDKIAEILGIDRQIIKEVNFYYTENKENVDEIIMTQVEDYNIAEQMILKVDELGVNSTTNLMLDLIVSQYLKFEENKHNLVYIGSFSEE
ncbi:hypothetical protein GJU39_20510 [Pedobacter petrophilus]|uniref:Immunity 22 family protein n=1 Tax=Pedobacter petrophilus TaxID=1908241 RepID=A0A7K0G3T0_9SPHI|nr:immunity 22 family protein [Pedobacter petrophilus]MRX78465.1 hypothetical protein [Pedobacter petrophilus]